MASDSHSVNTTDHTIRAVCASKSVTYPLFEKFRHGSQISVAANRQRKSTVTIFCARFTTLLFTKERSHTASVPESDENPCPKISVKNYMSHKVRANDPTSQCDCAMALVLGMAPVCQRELGKDQRRNGSRKKPAPSPLQRAPKQE